MTAWDEMWAKPFDFSREPVRTTVPDMGLSLPGRLSRTSWQLPADLALETWLACGRVLGQVEGAVQWWLGDWWAYGEHVYGERAALFEPGGVFEDMDFQTCMNYGAVARAVEPSRRREGVSFSHHAELVSLQPDNQAYWLGIIEREGISVAQLRDRIRQLRHQQAIAEIDGCTVRELEALIAAGRKFSVIYADPPWAFKVYSGKGKQRSADRHYDTQSLATIKALPIERLANDDCALLLWAVMPELAGALEVITAWGFTYKTVAFTWVKQNRSGRGLFTGMGYWTRANAELCLLATRGAPRRQARDVPQIVMSPVGAHSRKPQEVAARIERLLPGPYLELFGRAPMTNWTVWGNQITRGLFHQDIGELQ